jgi:hypothetical protein
VAAGLEALADIDTPDDYERLKNGLEKPNGEHHCDSK